MIGPWRKANEGAVKMQWVARTLLRRAADFLPSATPKPPIVEGRHMRRVSVRQLRKIAAENLAFLADYERIGSEVDAPGGFWRDLERVAQVLHLEERALEFHRRFHQALSRKARRHS